MDSVWFSCDDDLEGSSTESGFPYFGVLRESPQDIASWLPRPEAPFPLSCSLPNPSFGMNSLKQPCTVPASPPIHSFGVFGDSHEISVF